MARARNIKPGFFKNEDLAECSPWARLCFAGLWTLADREGRLEDRAKRIKGELFAFDTIDVEPLLGELAQYGFIERYVVDGRGLIQILEFLKHQHPHQKEPESSIPPPESPGLSPHGMAPESETAPASHEAKAPDKPGISEPKVILAGGSNPAESLSLESGALIPDPGALIPEKRKRAPPCAVDSPGVEDLVAAGFDAKAAGDFIAHKAAKAAPLTARAWRDHLAEAAKAGWSPLAAAEKVMAKNWKGFEAQYVVGLKANRADTAASDDAETKRILFGDKTHARA